MASCTPAELCESLKCTIGNAMTSAGGIQRIKLRDKELEYQTGRDFREMIEAVNMLCVISNRGVRRVRHGNIR